MKTLQRIWQDIRRGENVDLYLAVVTSFALGIFNLVTSQFVTAVTLLALGVIVITTLKVRDSSEELSEKLTHIEEYWPQQYAHIDSMLQKIMFAYTQGVQYLDDSSSVIDELQNTVKDSSEFIMALGSKSTALAYLEQIAQRVTSGNTAYFRLLTGDHITHDLHTHLESLLSNNETQIAWNRSEKYGSLTVSDKQVIFVLPTPYPTKFAGLKLPGERSVRLYNQYFMETFGKSTRIKTQTALKALCETCSPNTARNEKQIEQILRRELTTTH